VHIPDWDAALWSYHETIKQRSGASSATATEYQGDRVTRLVIPIQTILAHLKQHAPSDAVRRRRPEQGSQNDLFASEFIATPTEKHVGYSPITRSANNHQRW